MSRDPASPVRPPKPGDQPGKSAARQRLDSLVSSSRRALLWEHAWPALWWPIGVALAFLTVSWLGLWLDLSPAARQIGVAAFALAAVASLWKLVRVRTPDRRAALDRLDRDADHRPARSVEDTLALGSQDSGSRALWALHVRRAEAALAKLSVAAPRPLMARRDPFALRAAALLATVGAAVVAGPELGSRIGAAFQWRGPAPVAELFRIDGWIDPPLYTRLPPLMIDLAAGEQRLKAPVGSTVVIRMAGRGEVQLQPGPGLIQVASPEGAAAKPDLREQRYKLAETAAIGVRTGRAGSVRLSIEAIPDRPPEAALADAPELNARGTFTLAYKLSDDYGVASAEGLVERPDSGGRRSLVPAPRIALALPADTRSGEETKTIVDLTTHPWAGARVLLTLLARDEADQEGRSVPAEFTLPQRPFTKPLAKALVEQRRNLILDPDRRRPVQLALDSLLIAPERFTPEWGVFLGLRAAATRLRAARSDPELVEVADWLWAMALQIEDGDLSDAERQLRAAQEQLRDAIERGAPEEEIRKLTEELRTAMDRFLREFAERMQKEQQNGEQQASRAPDRTISQDDLNRMLNEMQEAMRRGDTAEAQRLLDQLRNILENLRTARPGNRMSDPMAREMNRQMEDMDNMVREQQELRDETFREGQNRRNQRRDGAGQRQSQRQQPGGRGQRQPGQQGQPGEQGQEGESGQEAQSGQGQEGQEGSGGLGRRQQALRERLQDLQRRMRGLGMQGEQGLADAEGAMRDAEGQLGQGRDGPAVDAQGRALEGLQRGMQGMAQQMQQMMGQNEGQDPGGEPGNPQGRASNDARSDDPLGRPTRSREMSDGRVRIPGADESAVARARRILEELRRKLGDPSRPVEELDYFERLLRRN